MLTLTVTKTVKLSNEELSILFHHCDRKLMEHTAIHNRILRTDASMLTVMDAVLSKIKPVLPEYGVRTPYKIITNGCGQLKEIKSEKVTLDSRALEQILHKEIG